MEENNGRVENESAEEQSNSGEKGIEKSEEQAEKVKRPYRLLIASPLFSVCKNQNCMIFIVYS